MAKVETMFTLRRAYGTVSLVEFRLHAESLFCDPRLHSTSYFATAITWRRIDNFALNISILVIWYILMIYQWSKIRAWYALKYMKWLNIVETQP